MIGDKKVVVVLPAYRAAKTLEVTFKEIPFRIVDEVVLVDDASPDSTVEVAQRLGIRHIKVHPNNRGYGGNQKTCYDTALALGADIVIMLHPDYQYTPLLIPAIAEMLGSDLYKVVFASRILGGGALRGGMPLYKYIANRFLTGIQNLLMGQKLSEYHTGYRAYTKEVLEAINYQNLSDDFVFDNQITAQLCYAGYTVAELTCPTKYFEEASSINFKRSVTYGLGVLKTSFQYWFQRRGIGKFKIFDGIRRG